ncbi:hypothetical protein [Corallococcus sp. CA054B]|uniref:hypothetical protein n=1 Tax=Corallococcus sp. CA054B TaxID=2316734 RepID=UPI0021006EC6|nr:hypothetical protein [Corallococcus sp. CA054B]
MDRGAPSPSRSFRSASAGSTLTAASAPAAACGSDASASARIWARSPLSTRRLKSGGMVMPSITCPRRMS